MLNSDRQEQYHTFDSQSSVSPQRDIENANNGRLATQSASADLHVHTQQSFWKKHQGKIGAGALLMIALAVISFYLLSLKKIVDDQGFDEAWKSRLRF